jgi:hypothetical protein
MRQEFFRPYYSPPFAALSVILFIGMAYGAWRRLQSHAPIWPFQQFDTPCSEFCAVIDHPLFQLVCFAALALYAAANPWLRKRSMMHPLIIIDDTGLWLREVGEVLPWSEIQSVEWRWWQAQFTIVWKRVPIRIFASLMDRDGTRWLPRFVHEVVKERWEQNRVGASAAGS